MSTDRTLSGLPAAGALSAADLVLVTQGGLSKKATVGDLAGAAVAAAAFQSEATESEAMAGASGDAVMTPRRVHAVTQAAVEAVTDAQTESAEEIETALAATNAAVAGKAATARTVTGAGLVVGGGDLSANRILTVTEASEAEAIAGAAADKAMTPRRVKAAVDAAVEAAVDTLQESLDDLAAAQGSGVIAAESWSVLAAYPTGARAAGDQARVTGADAGTHTDPVAGGTVANRGIYRWSTSPAGWKRVADLDADDAAASATAAAGHAAAALSAGIELRAPRGMPTSGMLRQYLFDEGVGDIVRNVLSPGAGDIDLTVAINPNVAWTSKGVRLTKGLMQTPSIIGARTVATLYRIKRGDVGLVLSGGSGPGAGVLGEAVSVTYNHWIACGSGIAPLAFHPTVGNVAYRLNRGGWLLIFTEFNGSYTTPIGWGGIHSYAGPGYRAEELEVAWAGVWDHTLDDDERDQVFLAVRSLARARGIYLHWEDCPDHFDCVLLWGQSGVTGYSLISDLSAGDQVRTATTSNVLVSHQTGTSGEWLMPEPFEFKYNHRAQGLLGSRMGPLPGIAWAHEDNRSARQRKLVVNQSAQDSTGLSISYPPSTTWNAGTSKGEGMLWAAMRHWWQTEQCLLRQGIGPRLRALWWFQGEQDCINTTLSATWESDIAEVWDATKTYLGTDPDFTMKLVKTPVLTALAGFDTAANDQVRAAQISFASAMADVDLIDCDDLPQQIVAWPHDEHFTGQGIKEVGARLYGATAQT